MPLIPGTRLRPYEIAAPLGAGGRGEVYKARDRRRGRDVAIKALTDGFANVDDRLARFQREAQIPGSRNHSNIAARYELEELNRARFEYVSDFQARSRTPDGKVMAGALLWRSNLWKFTRGAH
jgi:serine/threonine protein kinase